MPSKPRRCGLWVVSSGLCQSQRASRGSSGGLEPILVSIEPPINPPQPTGLGHGTGACFPSESPYNTRVPLFGRELNGRLPVWAVGRVARRPVFPPSERSSLSEGLEGLGAEGGRNRGKASHAAIRTCLSCAPRRQRAASRRNDCSVQGHHR